MGKEYRSKAFAVSHHGLQIRNESTKVVLVVEYLREKIVLKEEGSLHLHVCVMPSHPTYLTPKNCAVLIQERSVNLSRSSLSDNPEGSLLVCTTYAHLISVLKRVLPGPWLLPAASDELVV